MLELFSGSKVMSKAFKERGWEVFTVDYEAKYEPDLVADIMRAIPDDIIKAFGQPDVVWSSPDCTCFANTSIPFYWHNNKPKNQKTLNAIELHRRALYLTKTLAKKYWFIENPRAMLRTQAFMEGLPRYTITYCQYGDNRQKATDIWTNHPDPKFKPICHPGDKCHLPAPRGSHDNGTQGLKNSFERSKIPDQFCQHIVDICEQEPKNIAVMKQKLLIEA
jgi:hypothetical protein